MLLWSIVNLTKNLEAWEDFKDCPCGYQIYFLNEDFVVKRVRSMATTKWEQHMKT